ncbi:hypothetical protein [Hymenobacter sp. BRD67]|uniref:hypothetical protein n=1 Tax=Hymenobacter sp. BRD67 TaxID=2675877 RepID=UPI001563C714|nr:hypothetical protein [Hymenobacter sp. BRD67]QKG53015.1 hypothetical protein GKZ67_10870 [Hymenobacter sp. BRD67]
MQVDKLRLALPLAYTSFQQSTSGTSPDPNYNPEYYINYEPTTGNIASQQRYRDVLTSYQWGYSGQLPVATYHNADRTPPLSTDLSRGNEASSTGFESGVGAGGNPNEDYWNMTSSGQNFISSTAHTGNFSWHLGAATNGFNYGPGRLFSPVRQQLKYRFSAWVKTDAGFGANNGRLVLGVNRQDGSQVQGNSSCYQATSFSDTAGQWQYVEVILDLNAAHTSLGIAPSAEQFQLNAYVYNADGQAFLVDDMRFQPVDAAIVTYTYDAQSRQPTSISDARSYPTYYEYDAQQRLLLVKDHRKGIRQALEYHYQQH